jgi:hypothetical protein
MVPDPMPAVSNLRPPADRDGQPYLRPPLSLSLTLTLIAPAPSSPLQHSTNFPILTCTNTHLTFSGASPQSFATAIR